MIKISNKIISNNHPTYFIADIAANHDSSLERALMLIEKSAEAGADAAKFQHFSAETIVSDKGFKNFSSKLSHQKSWKKSVYEVYRDASINLEWTSKLKEKCDECGIEFMTSPYSYEMVDEVNEYINAFKIGSGDITWTGILDHICKKNKPILLATGASDLEDVKRAVGIINKYQNPLIIMQCNTNYTAEIENFRYINLNVLKNYKKNFPKTILGLSDHTHGHVTVLGAIALGARVIEKHFTDDNSREGPDHKFSMNPVTWKKMIEDSRLLELALGTDEKKIEFNEIETSLVQRRCLRLTRDILANTKIQESDLYPLRPNTTDGIQPYDLKKIIGKRLNKDLFYGDHVTWKDLE